MNLLIFFAVPLATILLAIVLEKILDNPVLVAITFFAIYLIIIFALFAFGVITDLATALIAVIIYTIIAYITAYIVRLVKCICNRFFDGCKCGFCSANSINNNNDTQEIDDNDVLGAADNANNNDCCCNANNNPPNTTNRNITNR